MDTPRKQHEATSEEIGSVLTAALPRLRATIQRKYHNLVHYDVDFVEEIVQQVCVTVLAKERKELPLDHIHNIMNQCALLLWRKYNSQASKRKMHFLEERHEYR